PGWAFDDPVIHGPRGAERIDRLLGSWAGREGLDPARICRVQRRTTEGQLDAEPALLVVPRRMRPGEEYEVRLVMRNTGLVPWTAPSLDRLGSQHPPDNDEWGTARVELRGAVPPGRKADFRFRVRAPLRQGRYPFRWRMVRDWVAWFGTPTDDV